MRSVLSASLAAAALVCFSALLQPAASDAVVIDRVIAYVDDRAITYSELRTRYELIKRTRPDMTERQTLDSMINALLMLQKAKKMRFEAPTEDELIREYMEVSIKSRVYVGEDKIREYYDKNRKEFMGREFEAVRPEIERYLVEVETNRRLQDHIKELRAGANIVIKDK
jgi:hypothetical protein